MNGLPPVLAALVDAPELDLNAASHALTAERDVEAAFDLALFLELAERLPSGLIHAETIWVTAAPPVGLEPLAPDSAWYAIDRSLVAAISPGRAALVALAADLGRYALAARSIAERLGPSDALVDALGAKLSPAHAAELGLRLGGGPEEIAKLEAHPSLGADLKELARRPFAPRIHLHPSTRPAKWRRIGASIGRRISDALPEGPFRLLISDAPEIVEHLSPYARDLNAELTAWAIENPRALTTRDLGDAVRAAVEAQDQRSHALHARTAPLDLAALIAPDLLRAHPELLAERRKIERSTGLELFDEAGVVFGFTDLSALAAPDPRAVPPGARGFLAIVAGAAGEALLEAAALLLDTGRVTGIGAVFGAEVGAQVVLPDVLVASDDAYECDWAGRLQKKGELIGVKASRVERFQITADERSPRTLLDLSRLVRRAQICGRTPPEARRIVVIYGNVKRGRTAPLDRRLSMVYASRLALASLCSAEGSSRTLSHEASKSSSSIRYRA